MSSKTLKPFMIDTISSIIDPYLSLDLCIDLSVFRVSAPDHISGHRASATQYKSQLSDAVTV